jgi:hypothetical protein
LEDHKCHLRVMCGVVKLVNKFITNPLLLSESEIKLFIYICTQSLLKSLDNKTTHNVPL